MFKSIDGGLLPQRATRHSAGFDVYSNEDVVIYAGETVLIGLGICLDFEQIDKMDGINYAQFYLELHPRSSLRAKGLGGGVGIIDIDFKNEIKMIIHNPFCGFDSDGNPTGGTGWGSYTIKRGDKIGQLILKRHEGWLLPTEYTKDEERIGGFGSSGK